MVASYKHIQVRRGLLNELDKANPILNDGEPAFATDAFVLKIGDGKTRWRNLPEFISSHKLTTKKIITNLPSIASYHSHTLYLSFENINLSDEYLVICQPKSVLQEGLRIDYSYVSDTNEIAVQFSYMPSTINGGNLSDSSSDLSTAVQSLELYAIVYTVFNSPPVVTTTPEPLPVIGEAYSFGNNQFGQLSLGDNDDRLEPELIDNIASWKSLSAGHYHSAGIDNDYNLLTGGYNYYGQLGLGDNENKNIFERIVTTYVDIDGVPQSYKTNAKFTKVDAGANHTSAIDSDGNLFTTGLNSYGCLGHGDSKTRNKMTLVSSTNSFYAPFDYRYGTPLEVINDKYTFPEAFSSYPLASRFVLNRHGEHKILNVPSTHPFAILNSGISDLISYSGQYFASSGEVLGTERPGLYPFYSGDIYISVSGNYNKASVYSLNYGYAGGEDLFYYKAPDAGWTDVSNGQQHTLGIKDNRLYSFGNNTFGQLGTGDRKNTSTPTEIFQIAETQSNTLNVKVNGIDAPLSFPIQQGIISVAVEGTFTLNYSCDPFTVDGGSGTEACISRKPIKGRINNGNIFDITSDYTLINTEDNATLYIFIDDSPLSDNNGILNVTVSSQSIIFEKVAAGNYHSLALDSDGNAWSFGQNDHGQLGHSDKTDRLYPTKINLTNYSLDNFKTTIIDQDSFFALRNNEMIFNLGYAGDNKEYQPTERYLLSDGTYVIYNVPSSYPITLLNNGFIDNISISGTNVGNESYEVTGTTNDGTYDFYWGDITINVSGNFDIVSVYSVSDGRTGTTDHSGYYGGENLFYYTQFNKKFVDISAGNNYSMFRTEDDKVYVCGSNEYGQLGQGDNRDSTSLIQIEGAWKEMSAGSNHILLVDEYKNIWGCGNNERGQLGLGDTINRSHLTKLRGDFNWTNPSAGGTHSLAAIYSYYPQKPTNVIARNADTSFKAGTDEIEVSWTQNESLIDGVQYYVVEVSVEGGDFEALPYQISNDPPKYKTIKVPDGDRQERTFRVKAVNSFGESEYSDITDPPIAATDLIDPNYCDVLFLTHFNGDVQEESQLPEFFKDYSKNDYSYETNLAVIPVKEDGGRFGSALHPYSPNNVHYVFDNTPSLSGDFTIEFFIKPTTTDGTRNLCRIENTLNIKNVDGKVTVDGYADNILDSVTPVLNTSDWSHIAWVRSGVVNSLFVNFENVSTVSEFSANSYDLTTNTDLYFELGLIDEVRISTIARYNPSSLYIEEIGRPFGEGDPNNC